MAAPGPWFAVAAATLIVFVLLIGSPPARADESLRASLDYAILAQPYLNSVKLNTTGPQTSVAVDRDPASPYYGTIYSVSGGVSGQNNTLDVQRSLDGGRSFDGPYVFDLCSWSNLSCGGTPAVAVGNRGAVYVAHGGTILRSIDRGLSWGTVAFSNNFGNSVIATDSGTGTVYVAGVNGSTYSGSGTDILVMNSVNGGQTWSRTVAVSGGGTGATPAIAALRDNVVVASVTSNASTGHPSVTTAASHDGGLIWRSTVAVSPPDLGSWSTPSVAVSPSGIFAVSWSSPVGGSSAYAFASFVSISRNNGDSFSAPIEVSRYPSYTGGGSGDALAFDNQSRLYVTWSTFENGSVYVANSTDLGQHFTNASLEGGGTNVSSENLDAGLDGWVYLTWAGYRSGLVGPYFRSVSGEASGDFVPGMALPLGTPVDVELVDPATAAVQVHATWTGSPLVLAELPPNIYDVWIRIGNASARAGAMPVHTWNTTAFIVRIEAAPSGPGAPLFPWAAAAAVGGVVAFVAAALLSLQHTRLLREEVLQRKVRLLLYETIQGEPGSSFTEVRDAVGLRNGVAAYHLKVLERQGFVHTKKGRHHRWYYPNGDVSLWRDLPLSSLQRSVVEQVRRTPGIGIRELARNLNRHHASVAYNVKGLAREGVLRTQRTGRKVHCFPSSEGGAE